MSPKFKWRKPKGAPQQPTPEQKNTEGHEKPEHTQVVIGPRVQVDFVNDLKKQHKAERDQDATQSRQQLSLDEDHRLFGVYL